MIDWLASPLTWVTFGIAFIGSLFACRGIADRFWFTLVTPVIYTILWLLCWMTLGAFAANLLPRADGQLVSEIIFILSTAACLGIFVVQVRSMARDPHGGPHGYAIRGRNLRAKPVGLQRSPMRKRMGG